MKVGDVVQFNENHKWCGCLGIITEVKDCGDNGIRYMVGSVEEKAQYKSLMFPYVLGAILLFSGTTLLNLIYRLATN